MIEEDRQHEAEAEAGEEEEAKAQAGEATEAGGEAAGEEAESAEPPLVYRAAELPVPSDRRVDRRTFLLDTIAVAGAGVLVTLLGACDGTDDTPDPDCSTDEGGGAGCSCVGVCTCDGEGGGSHYWYPT